LSKKSSSYCLPRDKYYSHYPLTSAAYLVVRAAGRQIERAASQYFKGKLLDIGCGEKWKQLLVGRWVDEYTGLDHQDTQHDASAVDIFGTADAIPVDDETFDSVLCTSVLEHVEEPQKAIAECYRVLKKGGYAVYTVPLIWPLHEEPRDFFRFTRYGLDHLFRQQGFKVIEITPLSGYWLTASALWAAYLRRFRRRRWWNPLRWLAPLLIVISHGFGSLLNKFDHSQEFTWMYLLTAFKE